MDTTAVCINHSGWEQTRGEKGAHDTAPDTHRGAWNIKAGNAHAQDGHAGGTGKDDAADNAQEDPQDEGRGGGTTQDVGEAGKNAGDEQAQKPVDERTPPARRLTEANAPGPDSGRPRFSPG